MNNKIAVVWALDWALVSEQVNPPLPKFYPVRGTVVGFIVDETDEHIALAHQSFEDGGYRNIVTLPKVCITRIERYETIPNADPDGA